MSATLLSLQAYDGMHKLLFRTLISTVSNPNLFPYSQHPYKWRTLTMRTKPFHLLLLLSAILAGFRVEAFPTGAVVEQLSSLIKWLRVPKPSQSDGNVLQFENGYLVETVVEGNKIGVEPHVIRVSPEGELFAVDSVNSNIVRITPPLSQYSRARLVAGSFQGYSGHVDGKPSDARFNRPKGVTMDEKGNVYVADTSNLAIRKIGEAGVTTMAGGKSNIAGYRDGPSEDAKFSNDFDVVYVGSICSLIVIDRGNAALRKISLKQEDCDYQYSSISASDILAVVGAVLLGYASCLLQNGFGSSWLSKMKETSVSGSKEHNTIEKPKLHVEALVEDPEAGWPSLGRLLSDLSKLTFEALHNAMLCLVPHNLLSWRARKGLTPLKDHLVMPEDKQEPPLTQKQKCLPPLSETLHDASSKFTPLKPQKISKQAYKDPSLTSKHRSSKRQDSSQFYGSGEAPTVGIKSQKERVRYRLHDSGFAQIVDLCSYSSQKPPWNCIELHDAPHLQECAGHRFSACPHSSRDGSLQHQPNRSNLRDVLLPSACEVIEDELWLRVER